MHYSAGNATKKRIMQWLALPGLLLVIACVGPGLPGIAAPDNLGYQTHSIDSDLIRHQERKRREIAHKTLPEPPEDGTFSDANEEKDYSYKIGIGDVLYIKLWERETLSFSNQQALSNKQLGVTVSEEGTIFYPFAGEMRVIGLSPSQLRKKVRNRLSKFFVNPKVDVSVLEYNAGRIAVTGEVNKPGSQRMGDWGTFVLDAIGRAEGLKEEADLENAKIVREDGQEEPINLLTLYYEGDASQNKRLRGGDILVIPGNHRNRVFVIGEVRRPRALSIHAGQMTLADALSDAGSLNLITAAANQIYVLRRAADIYMPASTMHSSATPNMKTAAHPMVDIYHLDASSAQNYALADRFLLQPRDVVYVGTSRVTHWSRFISQIVPSNLSTFISAQPFDGDTY